MDSGSNLLNNTLIYFIGTFGSRILSFLLLPLYSFYLTPEDFGYYDLVITTLSLLIPFITIQLSDATYRWLIESKNASMKKEAISSSFFLILASTGIIYIILLLLNYWVEIKYNLLLGFMIFSSSFFLFFQQVLRGFSKTKIFAFTGILNAVLLIIFNCLFVIWGNYGLFGVFLATVLSNSIIVVYILWMQKLFSFIKINHFQYSLLKSMIKYSAPLVPNVISWWLISASNRFIILFYMGIEANGIYAVSARFPAILTMINSVFMLAWQDFILFKEPSESKSFESRIFNIYVAFELSLVLILIFSSEFIINLFFAVEYSESWKFMSILYLGTALSAFAAYYGTFYLKEKRTKLIFITTLKGGLANVIITSLLINKIGLYAPALGTVLGFGITFLLRKRNLRTKFKLEINPVRSLLLLLLIVFSIMFILLSDSFILKIIFFFLSLLLFYLTNREIIKISYNHLKQTIGRR